MKRVVTHTALLTGSLLFLSGCGRLIDWGKDTFYQGQNIEKHLSEVEPYIKSVTIYDQLTTSANFSAIWLSDQVRTAYAQLHAFRYAKDQDKECAFLRRQLEENEHFISFYVLSTYEVKLGESTSHWNLFLQVDGVDYQPLSIKSVELPYEYQLFFKDNWNRFKTPYLVRFCAVDIDSNPIITDETKEIKLFTRSTYKQNAFVWKLTDEPVRWLEIKKTKKKKRVKKEKQYIPRKRKRK